MTSFKNTALTMALVLALSGVGSTLSAALATDAQAAVAPLNIQDYYVFYFVVDGGSGLRIEQLLKPQAVNGMPKLLNINTHFMMKDPDLDDHFVANPDQISAFRSVTVWPSSSLPGHVSNMTGAFPSTHYIGGQRGFLRVRPEHTRRADTFFGPRDFFFRSYIGPEFFFLNWTDISTKAKTMFEEFRPQVCGLNVSEQTYRGADVTHDPNPLDAGKFGVEAMANQLINHNLALPDGACPTDPALHGTVRSHIFTINFSELDHRSHKGLTDATEKRNGPGQPGIDDYAANMDKAVGSILSNLKKNFPKVYRKSIFILTGDHGMAPIMKDPTAPEDSSKAQHFDFPKSVADIGLRTYTGTQFDKTQLAAAVLPLLGKWGNALHVDIKGFIVRALSGFYAEAPDLKIEFESVSDNAGTRAVPAATYEKYQAVASFGGNSDGLLYLQGVDRSGGSLKSTWNQSVSHADIENYPFSATVSKDVPAELLRTVAKDVSGKPVNPVANVFYPDDKPGTFVIRSMKGRAKLEVRNAKTPSETYCYSVTTGQDPMGYLTDTDYLPPSQPLPAGLNIKSYGPPLQESIPSITRKYLLAKKDADGAVCLAPRTWLELTRLAFYPNALDRVYHAFGIRMASGAPVKEGWHEGSPMSPDLGATPVPGWDFYGGALGPVENLEGTHGALDYMQSIVPILISSPDAAVSTRLVTDAHGKRFTTLVGRTVDIVPTLMDLFGKPIDPAVHDGRSLLPASR